MTFREVPEGVWFILDSDSSGEMRMRNGLLVYILAGVRRGRPETEWHDEDGSLVIKLKPIAVSWVRTRIPKEDDIIHTISQTYFLLPMKNFFY